MKLELPDSVVPATLALIVNGDPKCDHDWVTTHEDEDVWFECSKCHRRLVGEVAQ